VVASHSSAHALCPHHRNLTDARLEGIAASGGVVGVNFFYAFIDPDNPTMDRLVDHLEHVAAVAGIDHVGLGPDFIKEVFLELPPPPDGLTFEGLDDKRTIPGLDGPAGLPLVTEALVRRGWRDDDIRKVLGDNWLRVFRSDLGVSVQAPAALQLAKTGP
jgi:membrane dipeptidase